MIPPDPAGNPRKRIRIAAGVALLCVICVVALISRRAGNPPPSPSPKMPATIAQGAGFSEAVEYLPQEASAEPSGSESAPITPPAEESDIFAPKEWSGPEFRRFLAHDPAGSEELESAYLHWRQTNFSLAEKVTGLAGERAEAAARKPWTRAELDQALRWVERLTEGETKFALLAELGKRLFAFDRAATAILSGQLKRHLYRDAYLGEIVEEWAIKDPMASSAWVDEFPEGELRTALQMKVAIRSAEKVPAAAADYVSSLDPGPARDAAAQTVVRQWAARDPRAAANWAASYPGEELRPELLSTAVVYWSRKDAAGLQSWIYEKPNDLIRRAAAELATKHQSRP